jgi:hypothetical protein
MVQVGDGDPSDRPVQLPLHEDQVEDPDDAPVDQVDQQGKAVDVEEQSDPTLGLAKYGEAGQLLKGVERPLSARRTVSGRHLIGHRQFLPPTLGAPGVRHSPRGNGCTQAGRPTSPGADEIASTAST